MKNQKMRPAQNEKRRTINDNLASEAEQKEEKEEEREQFFREAQPFCL